MGGYGSGGHNRKKRLVEEFNRIDSFVDVDIPEYIKTDVVCAGIRVSPYYRCPICQRRVRYLYDIKDGYYYACRKCLELNYSVQSLPRDEKAVIQAAKALQNIGIDTTGMSPWDIMHISFEDVKKMAGRKGQKDIDRYRNARNIWYECMARI